MNKNTPVTERNIQEALQRFKERGGLIRKLPPEVIPRALLVGTRKSRSTTTSVRRA